MKILFRIKNAFSMLGINKKYPEKKEPNVRNMVSILSRGNASLACGNIATEKTIKKLRDKILERNDTDLEGMRKKTKKHFKN